MGWFEDAIGGAKDSLGNMASSLGENSPQLLMLYLLGQYLNKQQNENYGTNPYNAAVTDLQGQRTGMKTMLDNALAGKTTNPTVSAVRTALQNRATTPPLTAPSAAQITAGQPKRYEGSAALPSSTMDNLRSLSTQRGAGYDNGLSALNTSLANRFGTRDMRSGNVSGALTPFGMQKPAVAPMTPAGTPVPTPTQGGGNAIAPNGNSVGANIGFAGQQNPATGSGMTTPSTPLNPQQWKDKIMAGSNLPGGLPGGSNAGLPPSLAGAAGYRTPSTTLNPQQWGSQLGLTGQQQAGAGNIMDIMRLMQMLGQQGMGA